MTRLCAKRKAEIVELRQYKAFDSGGEREI